MNKSLISRVQILLACVINFYLVESSILVDPIQKHFVDEAKR